MSTRTLAQAGRSARRLQRQTGLYLSRVRWLARDVWSTFGPRVLGVAAVNLLGVACAMASMGGAFLIARRLEKGEAIDLLGLRIEHLGETGTLTIIASLIALLGVLSAAFLYLAQWLIERIAAAHQKRNAARLFRVVTDPAYRGWPALVEGDPRRTISRMASTGLKMTGLSVIALLQMILPIAVFLASAAALVVIDPVVTLGLLPVAAVYLLPLLLINRGVVRVQKRVAEATSESRQSIDAGLRLAIDASAPHVIKQSWAEHALEGPEHARAARLLSHRRLSVQRIQAANTVVFVLAILGLLIFFGHATRTGERTWSEFLVYLVALRFLVGAIRQVTSKFIRLSRFHGAYRAYTEFIDDAESLRSMLAAQPAPTTPEKIIIRAPDEPLFESDLRLRLEPGQVAWLLSPDRPTHAVMQRLLAAASDALRGGGDLVTPALCYAGLPAVDQLRTLRENALGPSPDDAAARAHEQRLIAWGFGEEIERLPDGLDTRADHPASRAIDPAFLFALGAAALPDGAPVLALAARAGELGADRLTRVIDDLRPTYLFLAGDSPDDPMNGAFEPLDDRIVGAAVVLDGAVVACGDGAWLARARGSIRAAFDERRGVAGPGDDEAEIDAMDEEEI